MTTEAAQRRLLETIADLREVPRVDCGVSGDPFLSIAAGLEAAAVFAAGTEQPQVARIYVALGCLVLAVRGDFTTKESTND